MTTTTIERTEREQMDLAREWLRGDKPGAIADVARLGLDGAAQYNVDLAIAAEWYGIGVDAMRAALVEIC